MPSPAPLGARDVGAVVLAPQKASRCDELDRGPTFGEVIAPRAVRSPLFSVTPQQRALFRCGRVRATKDLGCEHFAHECPCAIQISCHAVVDLHRAVSLRDDLADCAIRILRCRQVHSIADPRLCPSGRLTARFERVRNIKWFSAVRT
jgi:hypothetical protein